MQHYTILYCNNIIMSDYPKLLHAMLCYIITSCHIMSHHGFLVVVGALARPSVPHAWTAHGWRACTPTHA